MTLVLRWRLADPPIVTRWRGPAGMAAVVERRPPGPIATIVGPTGPQGPQGVQGSPGTPLRFDQALAGTWIIAHGLGRCPIVQVFLDGGEQIAADVTVDEVHITVAFANPAQGFVLAA